jgi:large subunit ribosomal protein L25
MDMSLSIPLNKRETNTRGALNALRKNGRVPGVLYGRGMEPVLISADEGELRKATETKGLFQASLDGEQYQVMVRDVQVDPIKLRLLHVDLQRVTMNEPITTEIPLVLSGDATGVKNGGVLDQSLRMVEVRALPDRLPSEVTLDVSQLDIGDSITLTDVVLPAGVELLTDRETPVASILAPVRGEETEETPEPEQSE